LDAWAYLDALAFAFPFAWMLARAGCALGHEHPGRYIDLGLVECIAAAAVAAVFTWLARSGFRAFVPVLLATAGGVRLAIEPLRAGDSVAGVPLAMVLMISALIAYYARRPERGECTP
jgi:hypothetical protein